MMDDPLWWKIFWSVMSGVVARHPNDSHVYLQSLNLANKVYADYIEHQSERHTYHGGRA